MNSSLLAYFFVMNCAAFGAMGWDKHLARSGGRRIPEKTLLGLALLGGGVGAWLGMKQFRHKTKHVLFAYGLPVIAIAEFALLARIT
jgi:uncharacterized membrane protein YsdA (DUF1294 family)